MHVCFPVEVSRVTAPRTVHLIHYGNRGGSAVDHNDCVRMLTAFHTSRLSLHACMHTHVDVLLTGDSGSVVPSMGDTIVSVVPSMSVSLHW
jgi:hypothetical protein